jgi:hypothetical protein
MLDGNDNVRLVILQRSRTSAPATQLGRDLTVEPGGAVALSNCDLNAITFPEPSKLLALNLTRKMLRPLLRDFDMVLGRVIPKQVSPLRLLASYIEAVLNEPAPPTAEFSQLTIYDLAALTMGATRDAAGLASSRGVCARGCVPSSPTSVQIFIVMASRSNRSPDRTASRHATFRCCLRKRALHSQSLCSTDVSRARIGC